MMRRIQPSLASTPMAARLLFNMACALLFSCFCVTLSWAELVVKITQGKSSAVLVAVAPFIVDPRIASRGGVSDMHQIVSDDLVRSGQFKSLVTEDMLSYPSELSEVYYRDWRTLDVRYLVFGRISRENRRVFLLQFGLVDILREEVILQDEVFGALREVRTIAHYVSDAVYESITGTPGAYSTKLLYVAVDNLGTPQVTYRLQFSDADGARPSTLYKSKEPLLSPTWSPDGQKIAFVSFETGRPGIVMQNLLTGRRENITGLIGGNSSAPAFSPDGNQLAFVVRKAGNPDLYIKDLGSGKLRRVTKHYRIDTEPAWSPDGKALVFTSNRGGSPQLYWLTLASGSVRKLTFHGTYNARGRILPDGKTVVFIHRDKNNTFHIAAIRKGRSSIRTLVRAPLGESPSVAPNGAMIVYATQDAGQGILSVVSIDGQVRYKLPDTAGGAVREPAWSPFL